MDWPVCMNKNDIYFGELVPTPTSILRSSIALAHHFSHRVTFIRAHLSLARAELSLLSRALALEQLALTRLLSLRSSNPSSMGYLYARSSPFAYFATLNHEKSAFA